jgi:gamma-glutamyl:cysteine ligase YbdK (ATP-grasp superfamily)
VAADAPALGLFQGYGVELEYMIVDAQSLAVRPLADRVVLAEHGAIENEIERGRFAWSNELARHVIEIKTNGPVPSLAGLAQGFAGEIARIEQHLAPLSARLLPTGMHPWMDPAREFELWPHGDRAIYEAFHRIFDCRGHGWANLQSAHLNLPFANDDEFGRLHAAARALLPLLPALAAASPFVEGRPAGLQDARVDAYRGNARRVPSVTGAVIPEPVFTRAGYTALLEGVYADLAPHDPAGTLRHEWVNARGCIARFDRMALEIRLLDVQECPQADVAIAAAVSGVLRELCTAGAGSPRQRRLRSLETARLAALLSRTTADAQAATLDDAELLQALGLRPGARSAGDVWRELVARDVAGDPALAEHLPALEQILEEGPLARRLLARAGPEPTREALASLYREVADCLRAGRLLRGVPG